jgi:hypothetical protein
MTFTHLDVTKVNYIREVIINNSVLNRPYDLLS